MEQLIFALSFASAVGCGLMAGVFLAFSAFVMRALGRLPAPAGIAAMQSINIVVLNPLFLGIFFGTAAACVAVATALLAVPVEPFAMACGLAGSAFYLIGVVLVTMRCNVPLNRALARAEPCAVEAARLWQHYVVRWTAWNHVRTVAAAGAMALFMLALR